MKGAFGVIGSVFLTISIQYFFQERISNQILNWIFIILGFLGVIMLIIVLFLAIFDVFTKTINKEKERKKINGLIEAYSMLFFLQICSYLGILSLLQLLGWILFYPLRFLHYNLIYAIAYFVFIFIILMILFDKALEILANFFNPKIKQIEQEMEEYSN